jgi:cytochrome c oxidase subunit 2
MQRPRRRLSSGYRVLPAAAALLLAGCAEAPFNSTVGAGVEASRLALLGWWIIGLMAFVTLGMIVLVVWGGLRRRGSFDEHLPIHVDGGKGWIVIGGLVVPGAVLIALFFVTLAEFNARPVGFETADVTIDLTAHQWWWQFDYRKTGVDANSVGVGAGVGDRGGTRNGADGAGADGAGADGGPNGGEAERNRSSAGDGISAGFETANEIHVPVGKRIGVQVTADDVIHSFWAPKLFGKLDAIPGHRNYFVFEATQPGVYFGECAEFCGLQHANMQFTVIAETPERYAEWVDRQRKRAVEPQSPELMSGRDAFEEYACSLCHRVRGTRARGSVGPDLTHVGSRLTIAAGALPNTRARMQAWIVNSQALKPGNRMPKLEVFDGPTLNALAAYLESLK